MHLDMHGTRMERGFLFMLHVCMCTDPKISLQNETLTRNCASHDQCLMQGIGNKLAVVAILTYRKEDSI